jgi:hypothetical protein
MGGEILDSMKSMMGEATACFSTMFLAEAETWNGAAWAAGV